LGSPTPGERDFACKPSIVSSDGVVVGYRGDNVTISCKFTSDPPAVTKWLHDGRILTNMSQIPFSDQFYVITDSDAADKSGAYGVEKWLNLTITNVDAQDAGEYQCVGVNPGGMEQRNITLK
jgi:hypothetical protein